MGPTFNEFGFKRGLGYNWQISLSKPLNEMQKKSSATMSTRFVNSKFSTSNFLLTPIEIFFNFCQKTYEIQKTLGVIEGIGFLLFFFDTIMFGHKLEKK